MVLSYFHTLSSGSLSVQIGDYELWLTTPIFTHFNSEEQTPYYEVSLTHIRGDWHLYVDLGKFMSLNLTERNPMYTKVFGAKPKKSKDGEAEYLPLTHEEVEFRDEYQVYQSRKDMGMPMWKLSRRHVTELINKLQEHM